MYPCENMWICTPFCDRLRRQVAAIYSPTENHRIDFLAIWPSQLREKTRMTNRRDRCCQFCEQMWISSSCSLEVEKFKLSNKFTWTLFESLLWFWLHLYTNNTPKIVSMWKYVDMYSLLWQIAELSPSGAFKALKTGVHNISHFIFIFI